MISIIILNWNGRDDTVECLSSLQKIDQDVVNIIVVDNGSVDDSIEAITSEFPYVHLIKTGENLGYAGGNNVGIRYALDSGAEYILILNNDTYLDRNTIARLLEYDRSTESHCVIGPVIFYSQPRSTVWFGGAVWNTEKLTFDFPLQDERGELLPVEPYRTDYVCGAAMFFHRSITETIGLLDERFFLVWEESDWCLRARRAGIKCMIVPSSRIWHKVGASFGTESSPLREYYSYRNRLLWAEKNLDLFDRFKIILHAARPFIPRLSIGLNKKDPLLKRLFWAFSDMKKNWSSIFLKTKRQAVLDYIFRRFGNCPDVIYDYQKAWMMAQAHDEN